MASRLKSSWLTRAAVALAVIAFPAFVAGSAQAAIAGATSVASVNQGLSIGPHHPSQIPDLVSATLFPNTSGPDEMQVCFDTNVSPISNVLATPDMMYVTEYASDDFLIPDAATLDAAQNNCIDLTFLSDANTLNLGDATILTVDPDAVVSDVQGQPNLADSTQIVTSDSHAGIVGNSASPDLVGMSTPSTATTTTLNYVFDKAADLTAAGQTGFWIEDPNGNICYSISAAKATATTVTATFAFACGGYSAAENVTDADRAGVDAGSVTLAGSLVGGLGAGLRTDVTNPPGGTNIAGAANPGADGQGATSLEDLLSATPIIDGQHIQYQFDKPILTTGGANGANTINPTQFFVVLADGEKVYAPVGAATIGSSTTVDIEFPELNWGNEFAVAAGVTAAAVQAEGPGGVTPGPVGSVSTALPAPATGFFVTDSPGAVPFGGNPNASSQGYTSGPDMYAASFNAAGNVVTLDFDSRVTNSNLHEDPIAFNDSGSLKFYNAQGSMVGNGLIENVVIPLEPNPQETAVTVDVDPALWAQNPTAVQITGPSIPRSFPDFTTPSGDGVFCAFQDDLGNANPDAPATPIEGGSEFNTAGCSAPQIVEATVTPAAAHLKSEKKVSKKSDKKVSKKSKKAKKA